MITLKQLRFSNTFSYGTDNCINFDKASLTQLVGKNGHGKSSIALILEEVLFNKNSKNIKKGNILNRYTKEKAYTIELDFEADGVLYSIETKRGTTQTVKLSKAGVDISAHTATATYKHIEEIIGMDHKTFSQIVYQSHAGSLEFLTSPDTARKKFLIELLNLSKYTKAGDMFKALSQEVSKECAVAQGKVDVTLNWINKYEAQDFTPSDLHLVPQVPDSSEIAKLTLSLTDIEKTNKKISQNNTYKQLQSNIKLLPIPEKPTESTLKYIQDKADFDASVKSANAVVMKLRALHGTCPTCTQAIDENKTKELINEHITIHDEAKSNSEKIHKRIQELEAQKAAWDLAQKSQQEWEKYHQLIDTELASIPLDEQNIRATLTTLQKEVQEVKSKISKLEQENVLLTARNSKLDLIKSQLAEMSLELEEWSLKLHSLSQKLNKLSTLVKTFSTTGLVAYKIENLVKDLESLTNEYLGELSGGRFQISFQINGSDKLNVVITDNGSDIDIQALSGGERARVNIATLLAIRRLMQSLSQSRINLLILDETVESLDAEGKEKLIEVLLNEENLNTILVSHGFSHPLLEKVHVVKHNNISRIEE